VRVVTGWPGVRRAWRALLAALVLAAPPALAQALPAPRTPRPATVLVPVAARPRARGVALAAEDIAWIRAEPATRTPQPAAAVPDTGWITRRVIRAGEPLRPPAVAPAPVVRAGDEVEVVWTSGAVTVRRRGTVAASAGLGERVPVRIDARRRLTAIVVAPRVVRADCALRDAGCGDQP
jgi:flagella basal body P-ring formation protein FlgA